MSAAEASASPPVVDAVPDDVPGAEGLRLELIAVAAALVIEVLLAFAAMRFRWGVGWLLIGHLGVVGVLAHLVRLRMAAGADTTSSVLTLLATLVAGPVGALGSLALLATTLRPVKNSALLAAWYERIAMSVAVDPSSRLADSVASGRTIGLDAPPPQSFESVIARGSLAERQTALGLIARKFHPAYAPALQAALKSPEPVVRVQAAAVAARIRGELKGRVREALNDLAAKLASTDAALAAAADLDGYIRTGLLDEGDRLRAGAAVDRLKAAAAANLDGRAIPAATCPAAVARLIEGELLATGRHAEFRASRKIGRVLAAGHYRIRRIRRDGGRAGRASKGVA